MSGSDRPERTLAPVPEPQMSGDSSEPGDGPIPTPEPPQGSPLEDATGFPPPVRIPSGAVPTSIDWSVMTANETGQKWGVMTLSTPVGQAHYWFPAEFVHDVILPMVQNLHAALREPVLTDAKPTLLLPTGVERHPTARRPR